MRAELSRTLAGVPQSTHPFMALKGDMCLLIIYAISTSPNEHMQYILKLCSLGSLQVTQKAHDVVIHNSSETGICVPSQRLVYGSESFRK